MFNRNTARACRALLAIGLVAGLAGVPAQADENRRYQAVVLLDAGKSAQSGSLHPRVFLLDTRDGHMWTWEEKARVAGSQGPRFGTVITYQGRLRPGSRMGEVVEQAVDP